MYVILKNKRQALWYVTVDRRLSKATDEPITRLDYVITKY